MNAASSSRPSVLFALLDWGMGHATRTAPLIQYAIDRGWEVHVGTKGTALAFLKSQFADQPITFHNTPGPDITYAKRGTLFKIAGQMPGFLKSIADETAWTRTTVEAHGITHIVSDNCYGVHHPEVPAVLMSHQLQLPVPKGFEGPARLFVQQQPRNSVLCGFPMTTKPGSVVPSRSKTPCHTLDASASSPGFRWMHRPGRGRRSEWSVDRSPTAD